MDDDNPKAYKPAPGDKDAKTKPSKYTKQFKQMFGEEGGAGDLGTDKLRKQYEKDTPKEQQDPVKVARDSIAREKEQDRKRHDSVLDRARLARARMRNRETK